MNFPTDHPSIIQRLEQIKPIQYAATRNYTNGDVTYLSPYISRGVISLPQVAKQALKTHKAEGIIKFIQELAWREYWQRCWQYLGDQMFTDIKVTQQPTAHLNLPTAIKDAATGIDAIDQHIRQFYETGYLHNHLRMYIASITCNIGHAHWLTPSRWMYYHLLDGDLASNSLSWQWVAGTFSNKKYYCNQENINKYTGSNQQKSFLNQPYEVLPDIPIPESLLAHTVFEPITKLPETTAPTLDPQLPVLVYNAYNLDPAWHTGEPFNRILLLEPGHYAKYPVSEKVINFIVALAENIPGIQVYTANYNELQDICKEQELIFRKHPAYVHYTGTAEDSPQLFPQVSGSFNSFFAYWKKCERHLHDL